MNKLVEQYSGSGASEYDEKRVSTKRFQAEEEAFDKYLARCAPKSVFDLPVGTGRWLAKYAAASVEVLGVDASQDMLDEAKRKLAKFDSPKIALEIGDVLDRDYFAKIGRKFDLVICVRLLNWLPSDKAEIALANLDTIADSHILIGVGTLQGKKGTLQRLKAKMALNAKNARRRKRGETLEYVHDPDLIDAAAKRLGWTEIDRTYIFSRNGRDSYFVLYAKGQPRVQSG